MRSIVGRNVVRRMSLYLFAFHENMQVKFNPIYVEWNPHLKALDFIALELRFWKLSLNYMCLYQKADLFMHFQQMFIYSY